MRPLRRLMVMMMRMRKTVIGDVSRCTTKAGFDSNRTSFLVNGGTPYKTSSSSATTSAVKACTNGLQQYEIDTFRSSGVSE